MEKNFPTFETIFAQARTGVAHRDVKLVARRKSRQTCVKDTGCVTPVAVAEILLGGSGLVGGSTALLGATAQSISDLIDRSKKRSWLSIGSDFLP